MKPISMIISGIKDLQLSYRPIHLGSSEHAGEHVTMLTLYCHPQNIESRKCYQSSFAMEQTRCSSYRNFIVVCNTPFERKDRQGMNLYVLSHILTINSLTNKIYRRFKITYITYIYIDILASLLTQMLKR